MSTTRKISTDVCFIAVAPDRHRHHEQGDVPPAWHRLGGLGRRRFWGSGASAMDAIASRDKAGFPRASHHPFRVIARWQITTSSAVSLWLELTSRRSLVIASVPEDAAGQ